MEGLEKTPDERAFEGLAGCWKDCPEMNNVGQVIRESRTADLTHQIVEFTDREEINQLIYAYGKDSNDTHQRLYGNRTGGRRADIPGRPGRQVD